MKIITITEEQFRGEVISAMTKLTKEMAEKDNDATGGIIIALAGGVVGARVGEALFADDSKYLITEDQQ